MFKIMGDLYEAKSHHEYESKLLSKITRRVLKVSKKNSVHDTSNIMLALHEICSCNYEDAQRFKA